MEATDKTKTVKKSFLYYLKNQFPYDLDWSHPTSNMVWKNSEIKEALIKLKTTCPESYKVLWALWTTRETTSNLAKRFSYSTTVIKSRWERAVNIFMTILYYPDLYEPLIKYIK
jgi:hypothetical protein